MAKFHEAFKAFMAPTCNFIKPVTVQVAFANPRDYILNFDFGNSLQESEEFAAAIAATASPLPLLKTKLSVTNSAVTTGDFHWILETIEVPVDFSNPNITLQLNPSSSFFNGAKNTGSVVFANGLFTFTYNVTGSLLELPKTLSTSDGSKLIDIKLEISINGHVVEIIRYNGHASLNTLLKAKTSVTDILFTQLALSDGIHIENFRRPFNSSSLRGAIQFKDREHNIVAHLTFSANIDPNGTILGYLTNEANINDTGVVGNVTGTWNCDVLDLTIAHADIVGPCTGSYRIPLYSADITGTITLIAE